MQLDRSAGFDLVVMVASLGGAASAAAVLSRLPGDFPVPVVLLQHRRPGATGRLAEFLQRCTEIPVRNAGDGDVPRSGVTLIPPGYTARLGPDYELFLSQVERGSGGDTLLSSAAQTAGRRLIGVVLTGLLDDGTAGVRTVKRHGGRVLVEEPRTARAGAMPANALATGCVDFALPNTRIASALVALTLAPGGAAMFAVPTPAWASLGA